jgi:hypothetical protein
MTAHLYAEIKPALAGPETNAVKRVELVRSQGALESMAKAINVWPLTTFYNDEQPSTDKVQEAESPAAAEWSDPTRGLETIRALRERLQAKPDSADIGVEQAVAELTDLEGVLVAAQANKGRFRLYPKE